ncbi:MAG: GTP-binding protein TypA [Candidatus Yanofskybacteria bacterium RIFCSPHIGHO2_02_FULL_41_11]|uniref:50S ribosomal subunit assembly factor BipA n=1 Tax=Candidatus Yanofskybacteria bacterium RIFCSPHIGHO2_02_FULL_41_11 TaxID=1802675 RepID=A0A1F8F4S8_9BACT|nr:MAG: GTP-binding protein TypA [Candidatus Yanofskybacteria bacterium RIFCSPHIGHO2_02_FULL_41_11]
MNPIRNIAIIAHVDHGKTTLVDFLLKQSNTFHAKAEELSKNLIMDSNDLERERGITILAKNTSVEYNGTKINIIDTPGHADFGGEVERTLNMAEGALLLVDAQEGPMPQTKFVLKKAIELNLNIIVIVNKIDKSGADIKRTVDEVGNLFLNLSQEERHLDFPIIYTIGREGKAWDHVPSEEEKSQEANLEPLFEKIIEYIPAPKTDIEAPFQMLVANLDRDSYQGKYTIGKISRGKIKSGQLVAIIDPEGKTTNGQVDKIFTFRGLQRAEIAEAEAGDIVALTGISNAHIGATVADANNPEALPLIAVEEPTLRIRIGPNTSPFKGQEGTYLTSRQIAERLNQEIETNVGMRLQEMGSTDFMVSGRGELHLSILIETLRREGFELEISKPEVIIKETDGIKMEPFEEVTIDIPEEFMGIITTEFGKRKATMIDLINHNNGYSRLVYHISTQAFLGLRNLLVTNTKGTAVINSILLGYREAEEKLPRIRNGVLAASETGKAVAFGLQVAQGRGIVFIPQTTQVYEGMIVGLNSRREDLEINVCKGKELTNMRSKSADEAIILAPPVVFSLEQALDFIEDDELLEVTPKSIRLRKKYLTKNDRAKMKREISE